MDQNSQSNTYRAGTILPIKQAHQASQPRKPLQKLPTKEIGPSWYHTMTEANQNAT